MSDERDDVDAFADRDEDSTDGRFPYGGAPRRPDLDDEQWRRAAPASHRTGPAAGVADIVRATAAHLEAASRRDPLEATLGVCCNRCGKPAAVLLQPLGGGPRDLSGRCVGKVARPHVDLTAQACRAYKSGSRDAAAKLVHLMGRHEAETWMAAADQKRDGAKGGSW